MIERGGTLSGRANTADAAVLGTGGGGGRGGSPSLVILKVWTSASRGPIPWNDFLSDEGESGRDRPELDDRGW